MSECISIDKMAMYRRVKSMVFLATLVLIAPSCYYDVIITEAIDQGVEMSFSRDVIPLFQASCTSCHNGEVARPNLQSSSAYDLLVNGNYVSVDDGEESRLVKKIRSGHPYAGAVTETEIKKLVLWMEAGAENN